MGNTGTGIDSALALIDAMESLLIQAKVDNERRSDLRLAYFKPVTIEIPGVNPGDSPVLHSAFSRDLSMMGAGLLHDIEIEPGEVTLTFNVAAEGDIKIVTNILWCKPCGQGWYISGGAFVGVHV